MCDFPLRQHYWSLARLSEAARSERKARVMARGHVTTRTHTHNIWHSERLKESERLQFSHFLGNKRKARLPAERTELPQPAMSWPRFFPGLHTTQTSTVRNKGRWQKSHKYALSLEFKVSTGNNKEKNKRISEMMVRKASNPLCTHVTAYCAEISRGSTSRLLRIDRDRLASFRSAAFLQEVGVIPPRDVFTAHSLPRALIAVINWEICPDRCHLLSPCSVARQRLLEWSGFFLQNRRINFGDVITDEK